jgi:hypothetical protein
VDSFNHPHISYYDHGNADLKYARLTPGGWQVFLVDSADDVGQYSTIALDGQDRPHICYFDATFGMLKYAHR